MKLVEVYNRIPTYAWLEPAQGPENLRGVRLAVIDPVAPRVKEYTKNAIDSNDQDRVKQLERIGAQYKKQEQSYTTPDLGWWMSSEDFHDGKDGFDGLSKQQVLAKYPNLIIVNTKKEAISAAEEAGII